MGWIGRQTQPNSDDLLREICCILGMPIDAIEMSAVLHRMRVGLVSYSLLDAAE
jgi:hypothetical protein